jgi:hypothetical protein
MGETLAFLRGVGAVSIEEVSMGGYYRAHCPRMGKEK